MRLSLLLQVVVCIAIAGCGSKTEENKPRRTGTNEGGAPAQAISGNGIVRGKVTFTGTAPVMKPLPNAHCAEGGATSWMNP